MPNPPLFILGPGRAGTTLLASMVDAHPDVSVLPETWMFVVLERLGCVRTFRGTWPFVLYMNELYAHSRRYDVTAARAIAEVAADSPRYRGPTRPVLEAVMGRFRRARGATLCGEKTPAHSLRLPLLVETFPEARFLCILRDPRDVLASYARAWNKGAADEPFLSQTAALIKLYFRNLLMNEAWWQDRRSLRLRYEDLVASPAESMQKACAFLDVPFSDKTLAFQESQRVHQLSREKPHELLRKAVDPSRVGRFDSVFDDDHVAAIEELFRQEMEILDYDPVATASSNGDASAWARRAEKRSHRIMNPTNQMRARLRSTVKVWLHILLGRRVSERRGRALAVDREDWLRRAAEE